MFQAHLITRTEYQQELLEWENLFIRVKILVDELLKGDEQKKATDMLRTQLRAQREVLKQIYEK